MPTPTPHAFNFCSHGGQQVQPGAAVCVHCGFALPNAMNPQGFGVNPKSKWVAVLLCCFLGGLGIHNFYLGYAGRGVAQLLVFIFGFCVYVGPIITVVWSLVELIFLLADRIPDATGMPLKDGF